MATKAEQFRSSEQRGKKKGAAREGRSKPGSAPRDRSRLKKRSARKATHAFESVASGRPTRKSTRKSANRAKPDAAFNLTEALTKGSPEARFERARARAHEQTGRHS